MKKIDIEKELNLLNVVDIISLDIKDSFTYQKEEDGIRCVGPFYIHGRYSTLNEVNSFHDVFEFDIFAAQEKLDGEEFHIEYIGYDYSLSDGTKLNLHFNVYGIYGDTQDMQEDTQKVEVFDLRGVEDNLDSMASFDNATSQIVDSQDFSSFESVDEISNNEVEEDLPIEENEPEEAHEEVLIEELFDDKDNVITSYSFVVVKAEDSYETIAHRYHVDPQLLRDVNHDKVLEAKQLIVLPYGSVSNQVQEQNS